MPDQYIRHESAAGRIGFSRRAAGDLYQLHAEAVSLTLLRVRENVLATPH